MEGLGKETSICSSRPIPWLSHPEKEASTRLWKLTDCFSACEQPNTPSYNTNRQKIEYMESRKPILELKDVPPPPLHTAASQFFPLAPLPLLPPPCPPAPPPESLQPLTQPEGSPDVSVCSRHCEHCCTDPLGSYGLLSGGGSTSVNSRVPVYLPTSQEASVSRLGSSQIAATLLRPNPPFPSSGGGGGDAQGMLLPSGGYNLPYSSCVASTSQPLPAPQHSHLPCSCCKGGLLGPLSFTSVPLPHNECKFITPSAPLSAPQHGACNRGTAPRYFPSGVDYTPVTRGGLGAPALISDPQSPNVGHVCSSNHSVHFNLEHTVCRTGAHYCRDCFTKPGDKAWPNLPLPSSQSAPTPVPMCNGCGTASDGLLLLGSGLVSGTKYGSPEGPENIPPVGVFWDIENCCVPSNRSAAAVVQRLRSRFFQGHREAEFICVCDISKENKAVIQELNNCQVTVAHINATAKNAADDKLRQSLRRFAETHTAPAQVVLVSSDVNFASELSDLRHRHGFRVILVHKSGQTSDALLQHATCHVAFEEIVADLPPRQAVKPQLGFSLLYVYNLPPGRDTKSVSGRLRRLSDNCGGKVLGVSMANGTAVLRFGSQEAAERARKRMENEDVFGRRITLSFSPTPPPPSSKTPPSPSPAHPTPSFPPLASSFLPLEKPRSPRRNRRARRDGQREREASLPDPVPERPYSPRRGSEEAPYPGSPRNPTLPQELGSLENKPKMGVFPLEKGLRNASSSPQSNGDGPSRQGPVKAGLIGESMFRSGRSVSDSEHHVERGSGEFQVSTPSAFSKLTIHRTFSPLVLSHAQGLSQGSWSSRSASPCASSRSSPLIGPPPRGASSSPCRPEGSPALEPFSDGVDLQVANLDYRMSRKELQQCLYEAFSRHGRVKGVELSPHTDYQLKATVQMTSLQQAISAVSGLHRYKIGGKRIHVSLVTGAGNKSLAMLTSEIIQILQDAPANCLPLFKFTEIYEKKFGRKLAASDLYRLPEVVAVREQGGGRLVCLLPVGQARQSPLGSSQSQDGSSASGSPVVFEELEYHEPVCRLHYPQPNFSEADFDPDSYKIPFVVMSLKGLASHVHCLLQSHEGSLPLLSFPECYESEFGSLAISEEGTVDGGVPLEHLITCIPGINIVTAQNGFKVIKWIHNKPPAPNTDAWLQRCKSPVGNPQLIQFSREIIDLVKNQPRSLMPLGKFIPAYHHHYAKQCRVSDYGYSKLLELLEAVPHVLQILGMGNKRMLTLTHRAQVKRFTQDLLKLLKFQASKQVEVKDFMQAYHWCFSRDWQVLDYGMCDLMDLLAEIPDTTITITQQDVDTVISVPKRERTTDEIERTRQFAKEVVDLLRHQPHCRMAFSKFIPTYHHHFGRQCKLTYYGFTKLIELFEAIPDVLTVLECGEEKVLTLTEMERVKALAAQLVKLLRSQRDSSLPAAQLLSEYSKTFGYGLRLQDYDVSSLPALLVKLCHVVKVVDGANGREVQLINRKSLRSLTCQLLALLMGLGQHEGDGSVSVEGLSLLYQSVHGLQLNPCEYGFLSLSELLKSLPYLVELFYDKGEEEGERGEERVRLTRLYQFARSVRALLHTYHYHQIFLTEFPGAYAKFTGRSLQPRSYGYATVDDLLNAIPQVVWIKGHGHKRIIVLKNDMKAVRATGSSPAASEDPEDGNRDGTGTNPEAGPLIQGGGAVEAELLCLSSPLDLLCGPVPSCLPSPQLHPDPILLEPADLIRFEQTPSPAESNTQVEEAVAEMAAPTVCSDGPKEGPLTVDHQNRVPLVSAATKSPHSAGLKMETAENSPGRRAPRNKVKLAANFSFTASH
ncbi:meiosis regulator and mRNA stability factor 1 isoform X3 [Esox lucius]|uniref:meiosis regulator and mRNA stability factor 1 isoform X3 n=1 Tax=Esox lucius TaxID=8010 RepID=UPI001476BC59|nr:meiosis regulator and mRNA stability factor 1 isoform X3 [Esox lucius]